ncbi:MAG: hypothetical protein LBM60_05495 [Clostridium sp.]|jgi:hypothetical protein|nr:hypothetical protein [Clostridium sp.]
MSKSRKNVFILILLVCIVLVLAVYAILVNKNRKVERDQYNQIELTLSKDLELDYPPTPRMVLIYYHELLSAMYSKDCTKDQLRRLGEKARQLYDADLLTANEPTNYLVSLYGDIDEFHEQGRSIASFTVSSAINAQEFVQDGYTFTRLAAGYTVTEKSVSHPTNLLYLLRKDDAGKWRIFGWDLAENVIPSSE